MGSVRVAIIGVGNCASALVQGVHYYKNAPDDGFIPGLMQPRLAGYHVGDIEFSAAFDVDVNKVGRDLSEAIWAKPNCAGSPTSWPCTSSRAGSASQPCTTTSAVVLWLMMRIYAMPMISNACWDPASI